jgi:5-methylcytosine-specific restriction enzyme A
MFACPTCELRRGADLNGDERCVIVFHLVQPIARRAQETPLRPATADASLNHLREEAYRAASRAEGANPRETRRLYRRRSAAVRRYVLARTAGSCEACGSPAPFQRPDETPYLEPHHTRRLTNGGPDHPRWVGAICPNCHREVHHGVNGEEKNKALQERLGALEN